MRERRMDILVRIKGFIAVAENRGFTSAGKKLGKSKALLSKYVSELEEDLGMMLLNRTSRSVSLTDAGRDYLVKAKAMLVHIDALQSGETVPLVSLPSSAAKVTAPSIKRSAALEALSAAERIGYLKGVVITSLMTHGETGEARLIRRAQQAMQVLVDITNQPERKNEEDQRSLLIS